MKILLIGAGGPDGLFSRSEATAIVRALRGTLAPIQPHQQVNWRRATETTVCRDCAKTSGSLPVWTLFSLANQYTRSMAAVELLLHRGGHRRRQQHQQVGWWKLFGH